MKNLSGYFDPSFKAVAEAFRANFDEGLEVGASCAVVLEGRPVVDVWGGSVDDLPGAAGWQEHTIVNLMSVAKGFLALVVHQLVERGRLRLDEPVSTYWPEFAQQGKGDILVRHLLAHTAGLEVLTEPLWPGAVYDWAAMVGALERQRPLHAAGEQPAYHTITISFLVGELVQRVTGRQYRDVLHDQVTGPVDADYHLALTREQITRCARFLRWSGYNLPGHGDDGPSSLLVQAWAQFDPDDDWNSPEFHTHQIPGVNGHGNARAVAKVYGALANGLLLGAAALDEATTVQWAATEPVLSHEYRMGLGFTLNSPDAYMGPNPRAFGHVGAGGATGLCDPDLRMGFSYGMNLMHPSRDNGPRARRLLDALYGCL